MRGVGVRSEGCITFRNSVGWYWLIYFTPEIGCFTKQTCKEVPLFGERIIHEAESCVQTHSLQIHVCRASKQTLPGRSFHQQHEASLWQRTASRTMPPSARVLMAGTRAARRGPCRVGWEVPGVLRQQMDIPMVFLGVEVAEMVRFSAPTFGIWGPKWRVDS